MILQVLFCLKSLKKKFLGSVGSGFLIYRNKKILGFKKEEDIFNIFSIKCFIYYKYL